MGLHKYMSFSSLRLGILHDNFVIPSIDDYDSDNIGRFKNMPWWIIPFESGTPHILQQSLCKGCSFLT